MRSVFTTLVATELVLAIGLVNPRLEEPAVLAMAFRCCAEGTLGDSLNSGAGGLLFVDGVVDGGRRRGGVENGGFNVREELEGGILLVIGVGGMMEGEGRLAELEVDEMGAGNNNDVVVDNDPIVDDNENANDCGDGVAATIDTDCEEFDSIIRVVVFGVVAAAP